jgi:hypothetical protein
VRRATVHNALTPRGKRLFCSLLLVVPPCSTSQLFIFSSSQFLIFSTRSFIVKRLEHINNMATDHNSPLEKDFSNHNGGGYHLNDMSLDNETALKRIRTAGSISISPELFEKIYLSPQNAVKGDLRKTFGNPTPV